MADLAKLVVALVYACVCCFVIASGAIGTLYTCTDGTMDPDKFDQDMCFSADALAPGKSARYVRLQASRKDHLNVSEIIVVGDKGKNIALGKTVNASSVHDDVLPGNATSGLGRANYAITSNESENEYLEIDLGSEKMVHKVIVMNRSSCCKDRIKGCRITLSDKDKTEVSTSSDITAEAEAYVWKVGTESVSTLKYDEIDAEMLKKTVTGRYIEIRHTKKDTVINLAGLSVWRESDKDTNLAEGKSVTANSVHPAGPLANLVDGKDDTFAHTHGPKTVGDHMLVDLGAEVEFSGITLTNRKDCCKERAVGIQVSIMNKDKQVIIRTPPIPNGSNNAREKHVFDFADTAFAWQ